MKKCPNESTSIAQYVSIQTEKKIHENIYSGVYKFNKYLQLLFNLLAIAEHHNNDTWDSLYQKSTLHHHYHQLPIGYPLLTVSV